MRAFVTSLLAKFYEVDEYRHPEDTPLWYKQADIRHLRHFATDMAHTVIDNAMKPISNSLEERYACRYCDALFGIAGETDEDEGYYHGVHYPTCPAQKAMDYLRDEKEDL